MLRALLSLPVVTLVAAALDAAGVRRSLPHRPAEARLFAEAWALWAAYGLLALIPTWCTLALLARRRGEASERRWTAPLVLAFWTVAPILAHGVLSSFFQGVQDLDALGRPLPWLATLGTVIVVVAVAWGLVRLLERAPTPAVAGALVLLALPVGLALGGSEEPTAAPGEGERPNLLLLVWDTCRADHTEPYGYDRATTPGLAQLAEESLVYEQARSVSVFTFTSHLSMLTGVLPSTHGARLLRSRYDPRRADTIAETLRRAGYRTGAFVGTDVLAGRTGIRHGFEVYSDRVDPRVCDTRAWKLLHDAQALLARTVPALRNNGQPHWIQDFQRAAPEVLAEASAWIAREDPRPWFCMINLYDVHWPYLPSQEARDRLVRSYNGAFDGYLFRSDAYDGSTVPDATDARHVADLYDAELYELDARVRTFLDGLDLDRTAVLLTSDHGEAFGEAGTWKHEDIFEPQLRIPFLVRLPGAARSGRIDAPVSGIDVAPTLLGLAGVAPESELQGVDLLAAELGPERQILVEDRDHVDATDVRLALYQGPWKLVRRGLGDQATFSLHDLTADPVGEVDVAAEHPELFASLRERLEALRGDLDEREAAAAAELGGQAAGLAALGYL